MFFELIAAIFRHGITPSKDRIPYPLSHGNKEYCGATCVTQPFSGPHHSASPINEKPVKNSSYFVNVVVCMLANKKAKELI